MNTIVIVDPVRFVIHNDKKYYNVKDIIVSDDFPGIDNEEDFWMQTKRKMCEDLDAVSVISSTNETYYCWDAFGEEIKSTFLEVAPKKFKTKPKELKTISELISSDFSPVFKNWESLFKRTLTQRQKDENITRIYDKITYFPVFLTMCYIKGLKRDFDDTDMPVMLRLFLTEYYVDHAKEYALKDYMNIHEVFTEMKSKKPSKLMMPPAQIVIDEFERYFLERVHGYNPDLALNIENDDDEDTDFLYPGPCFLRPYFFFKSVSSEDLSEYLELRYDKLWESVDDADTNKEFTKTVEAYCLEREKLRRFAKGYDSRLSSFEEVFSICELYDEEEYHQV